MLALSPVLTLHSKRWVTFSLRLVALVIFLFFFLCQYQMEAGCMNSETHFIAWCLA